MDFPSINSPTGREQAQSPAPRQPRTIFSAWFLLLLMAAAVFGPCTAIQVPREIGRWRLAQAIRLREAGDKQAAFQRLDEAVGWFPKSMELRLTRAEWLLEDGQREEALAAIDQMLEIAGETEDTLKAHSQFLQNAGEFKRAVEDWKKLARQSEVSGSPSRTEAMNGLAYAQALAHVELEDALENVNVALSSSPTSAANPLYLDTRGYIYYRQAQEASGDEAKELLEKGLADMNPSVRAMDRIVAQVNPSRGSQTPEPVKQAREMLPKTLRDTDSSLENALRASAVMHYHRALILQALNRNKEAAAELAVVKRMIGREPDDTLF